MSNNNIEIQSAKLDNIPIGYSIITTSPQTASNFDFQLQVLFKSGFSYESLEIGVDARSKNDNAILFTDYIPNINIKEDSFYKKTFQMITMSGKPLIQCPFEYRLIGGLDDLWNLVIKINPRLFTIDGVNPPDATIGKNDVCSQQKKDVINLSRGHFIR